MDFPAIGGSDSGSGQVLPGRFYIGLLPGRFHIAARAFVIGAFRRTDPDTGCYHEEKAT
jgi:hypothetical protein